MATTVSSTYTFGTFAYKGFLYVLESEFTGGLYYLLSKMYKYDPADPNLNVVATYTFQKRYITGPRGHYSGYYGNQVDISVDEIGGRVLCVFTVGILINMETLTPTGTNYYKVFAETSEYATYISGGTIYYAAREGASGYGGDAHTSYIALDDNYVDSTPPASNPGLTPLGSAHGLLIPSLNGRYVDYYLSPSHYGFKKQNLSTGAITEYVTPTGMARGFTPGVNYGNGPYWDHTWVDKFIYGDDGYVYVFLRIVYGHSYFGLYDPLGNYDVCILKYSVGATGALTEVARKLFSQATTITPQGSVGAYPLYAPVLLGATVSNGYIYYSFHQYVYGNHGQTILVKLRCSDLSTITSTNAPHYAASAANNTGHLLVWKQTFGEDRLLYYCAQGHVHFMDTDFVDALTPITINDGVNYGYSQVGSMYSIGIRGPVGYVIFPGWHDAQYVDFKSITWLPDCVGIDDIPPQDMSEEILTNEFWGIGIDPAYLETTMTAEARAYAVANDLLYSFIFDQQRGVLDGLSYIAGHHNGFYTVGGGLVAHRQLEIDDEVVLWGTSTINGDNFGDGMVGDQWRMIGDTPPSARVNYQALHYTDIVNMAMSRRIVAVQSMKITEARTVDPGYRNVNAAQAMRITENRVMDFSIRFINVNDRYKYSENRELKHSDSFVNVTQTMRISEARSLSSLLTLRPVQLLAYTENIVVTDLNVYATDNTVVWDGTQVPASGNFYPAVSGDDYEWYSGTFWSNLAWWGFGAHDQSYHGGIRFPSVNIPKNSQITSAYMSFTGYQNNEGNDPHIHIYGNNVDNATVPTSVASAEALALTSAMVEWNPETWMQNVVYSSPDVSTIIYEIVTRTSWNSGNALQIIVRNQTTVAANHSRSCYSYDGSVAKRPVLHIEWLISGGIAIV